MSGSNSDDGGGDIKPFTAEQEEKDGGGAEHPETPPDQLLSDVSEMQGGEGSVAIPHAESREEMFVDAADDIVQDGQFQESESENELKADEEDESSTSEGVVEGLRAKLARALAEKESIEKELKEERESCSREVAGLREQLKGLADEWSADGEVGTDGSLPEMINECSQFVKVAFVQKLQAEKTMNELQQTIGDLSVKVQGDQEVEVVVDRMMSSLGTVVNPGDLLDYSILGKVAYVERSTSLLMEQYAWMLYEIDQFRHSMAEAGTNVEVQGEYGWGSLFATAKTEYLELKTREVEMVEKIARLEDQSGKLVEEVQKAKEASEVVKAELEREKSRCANTKEKLSMAVTKGKALVQQRDSLKQSLAEKASELEKCLTELQEKTSAVEAAQHCKEELAKYEAILAETVVYEDLQSVDLEGKLRWVVKSLSEKIAMFENVEESLSQASIPEELNSADTAVRLKWVLDLVISLKETVSLKDIILGDFEQVIGQISIPDEVQSVEPIGRLKWLAEDWQKLKDESATAKESAKKEIDHLTTSLAAEIQEKEYLKTKLDELAGKHEEMVETEHRVLSERDKMVNMLVEGSGVDIDGLEGSYHSFSDVSFVIGRCLDKMKEKNRASFAISPADAEAFGRMQSVLYIRDQELILCKTLLEEDDVAQSNLLDSLRVASKELEVLREEKASMTNDLNRSEEKSSLLREKLSLAVKKGKGLVQDRENLKLLLDEKKSEIEKLKLEISRLSADLEQVQKLEADLVAAQEQRDQFEQLLLESNNTLQKVMESFDHITLPVDSTFEDPVGKIKSVADYLSECQRAKHHLEEELDGAKEEYSVLASKLAEAQLNLKSVEDALSGAENHISELAEEKKNVELDLQKALEEVTARTSEWTEANSAKISLEDALSLAENNIAVLVKEREEALISKAAVETEFEKVREEVDIQSGKLTDAYKSMKSQEDTLSQAEAQVALLTEENNSFQAGRTDLENELKKLKDEAAGKLEDSSLTIKSLEDALSKAMNGISALEHDKRIAEQEISTLNSKLNACMDELAGTSGSLASKSVELISHLTDLQMLTKNDELLSVMRHHFEKQFQNLNNMDLILKDMNIWCDNGDSQMLHIHPVMDDSHARKAFPYETGSITLSEMENGDMNSADLDNVSVYFKKFRDGLQLRNKILAENFEGFSSFIDEFVGSLLSKLKATKDAQTVTFEQMESMKQKMMDLEVHNEERNQALSSLDKEHKFLLSACVDATRELQIDFVNSLLDLKSVPELEKLNHSIPSVKEESYDGGKTEPMNLAENLLSAARKVQNHMKLFECTSKVAAGMIEDLQNKVTASATTSESILRERDLLQTRVGELESELEALQNSCRQLRADLGDREGIVREKDLLQSRVAELDADVEVKQNMCQQLKAKLGDYERIVSEREVVESRVVELQAEAEASNNLCQQLRSKLVDYESIIRERDQLHSKVAKLETDLGDYNNLEEKLKENEAKLSTLQSNSSKKEQEKVEDPLMSTSELRVLFDKISSIDIFNSELEVGAAVGSHHSSVDVNKLFYIVDSVSRLHNEINVLASEKDQLQTSLSQQIVELELLKEDVRAHSRNQQDVEMMKAEVSEMTATLERVIDALSGNEVVAAADQNPAGPRWLLQQLEKQAKALLSEADNAKSQAQELGNRLLESQNVIDELTTKVKMLEDSVQSRSATQPETFQERSIMFEGSSLPSGSEISEVDDAGSVGKNPSPPVPKAAHVRTTRKGSTDHLALNIDSESATLINKEETDEDKGHVFKSLNTSGLIPKQGKSVADRVDGIWVSGGRVLMSRPRARLGLIAYWLLLHVWVLATIL